MSSRQKKILLLKQFLTILPASLLGLFAMIYNEVPPSIWLQNIIAMILCGTLAFVFVNKNIKANHLIIALAALFLLILTLFMNGLEGVNRWLGLTTFQINVAMVVLPILLISISNLLKTPKTSYVFIIIIIGATILYLQPDASQLTGFTLPIIFFLFARKTKVFAKYLTAGLLLCLTIGSWIFLDSLEPVSYVEEILELLNEISTLWAIAGVIALIFIILPFILFPPVKDRVSSIGIGIYYIIIILSAIFGNFPVPIMGYGISPIIGYWIICRWYVNEQNTDFLT